MIWGMFDKENHFATDKGKSFIFRAFIKAEMIFFCLHAKFHLIKNIFKCFFHSLLIQFFFINFLVQDANI